MFNNEYGVKHLIVYVKYHPQNVKAIDSSCQNHLFSGFTNPNYITLITQEVRVQLKY